MPVGCDSIEPTDNSIRRLFTAISTLPRAATAVEISFTILLFWVTIRRSNQLNYAPASRKFELLSLLGLPVPLHSLSCPPVPSRYLWPCRDRAEVSF